MLQPSQIRYHWYLLRSREALKKHFKISGELIAKILPEDDVDRYARGQMVNIGGILAKRCAACCTAREVEHFWGDNARRSGCRAVCDKCRDSGNKSRGYNEFQRRKSRGSQ